MKVKLIKKHHIGDIGETVNVSNVQAAYFVKLKIGEYVNEVDENKRLQEIIMRDLTV